jgi:glucose/arabinose dehydrogenase
MKKQQRYRHLRIETLESRKLLAADTYLVNFQFDEATIPTRYMRDTGDLFGVRANGLSYGWSSDHTDQSRERNVEPDQRLDTLVHVEAGQFWEFELPSGSYEVTVAVGDPANNDGVHTINVEGVNYWTAVPDGDTSLVQTQVVNVVDGRLTIDAGAAAEKATRIQYVHIVGLAEPGNTAPSGPFILEPLEDGQIVNPADVHMEAIGFFDVDGDAHYSTDWEIWTTGPGAAPVWQTLGIQGVERLHTHLGDGVFMNDQAGEIALAANTDYELRTRFRDSAGSVSDWSTRLFTTGDASTIFSLDIQDIAAAPEPTWVFVGGGDVDLPTGNGLLTPGDAIIAIDLDSDTGTNSASPGGEGVANVIDNNVGTKYLNFGELNTGFIVTPGASVVRSFTITTANDVAARDPVSFVLQGTNDTITSAPHSNGRNENWTTIATGSIAAPVARLATASPISFTNNTSYTSYRLFFPEVRNPDAANSMQLAEVDFWSGTAATGTNIIAPDAFIIPIQDAEPAGGSESNFPGGESPAQAIDGNPGTKYLNFGRENSGFIVTPSAGATTVTSFQITTANDAVERDPTGWALYGTNDAIQSQNNSFGNAENWTLIDTGSLDLPAARNAPGAVVAVDNNVAYTSYRMIFTGVKDAGAADSVQIAEVQFFGDGGGSATPSRLTIEAGGTGQPFLEIEAIEGPGNLVTDFAAFANHAPVRLVIEAGSQGLVLGQTDLSFVDGTGRNFVIFLPSINLPSDGRLDLWVSSSGGTYFGTPLQTEPDFSTVARDAELAVPFVVTQAGFVIEEVGTDYRLPVNIAFVPNPGPNPDDPLYYVTELYGSIQVVTRDGTRHEFATGLLDYNPTGPISGSGEQGLTGIAVRRDEVDPDIYHLYVGMLWDNGSPPGGATHYPKVEHMTSVAGGLALDSREVLLNMQPETQGQSHQISNVSIGPDGNLYVHMGDGFNASTGLNLDQYRGSILRMDLEGNPLPDNPFYDGGDRDPRDYIWAYGFRNPFGGAWRASDGQLYSVENGPSVDRMVQVVGGESYGWNGSNASMFINAIYNWTTAHAPVNIDFIEREMFAGSQFPAYLQDVAFVSESGPTYATGPQANGKQISYFRLDENGAVVEGPIPLVQYVGEGQSTIVALAAGPDGLYFSTLYEDSGANGATATGARLYRVRYINPIAGDYDIDGDVDQDDYNVWRSSFGSTLLLAADGNGDGVVDAADYTVWRDNLGFGVPPEPAGLALAGEPPAASLIAASPTDESSSIGDVGVDPMLSHGFDGAIGGQTPVNPLPASAVGLRNFGPAVDIWFELRSGRNDDGANSRFLAADSDDPARYADQADEVFATLGQGDTLLDSSPVSTRQPRAFRPAGRR